MKKPLCFAEISHRWIKLLQISMPSWFDCYKSIHFFLLCTTGKISIIKGGETQRFCPFLKPASHKTEEHHRQYRNSFFPSHVAVTSTLLPYWYHSQQLTYNATGRDKFSLKNLIYLLISLKETACLFSMGQTFHQISYTWQNMDFSYTKYHERIICSYRNQITICKEKEPDDEQVDHREFK